MLVGSRMLCLGFPLPQYTSMYVEYVHASMRQPTVITPSRALNLPVSKLRFKQADFRNPRG